MNKIKQWCDAIRQEDGRRLSSGSIRTLKMIEDEFARIQTNLISSKQDVMLSLPLILERIADNYTHVLYRGNERRWCTNEVAEIGSANESDYMTTDEFAKMLSGIGA